MSGKWSDLPHDLLSQIAKGLGLIDFLSFRAVCKDWNTASFKVSPDDRSVLCDPWFLMYGEGSKCSLLSQQNKFYSINLPEFDGATCLASFQGWLLLFGHGSLFFFCPFSRAKVELPNCPFTEASDHVAAFSASPTSKDCIVVVLNSSSVTELQLFMLCKGEDQWVKSCFLGYRFSKIRTALYYEDNEFHFLDGENGLVTFSASKSKQWNKYCMRVYTGKSSASPLLHYIIRNNAFQSKNEMREKGLLEANDSISTCGTIVPHVSGVYDMIIRSESIEAITSQPGSRHLKGVWIQPRYLYAPSNQTW